MLLAHGTSRDTTPKLRLASLSAPDKDKPASVKARASPTIEERKAEREGTPSPASSTRATSDSEPTKEDKVEDAGIRDAKTKNAIARELRIWEKVVFAFDMDKNVGAGGSGSGKGPARPRDGSSSDRSDGGRPPALQRPESFNAPPDIIAQQRRQSAAAELSAARGGPSSSRTHGGPQTHHALPHLHPPQQPPPPNAPLHVPPGQLPPLQGPFGALDPYTVAQLAAISAMYPNSGVPDPYELLSRAQQMQQQPTYPQGSGSFPPSPAAVAPPYPPQRQMSLGAGSGSHPSHTHTQGHGQQHPPPHQGHPQYPQVGNVPWQVHQQHVGHGALSPSQPSPVHGDQQQQSLPYPHGYQGMYPQQPLAGPSTSGAAQMENILAGHAYSPPPMSPTNQQEFAQGDVDEAALSEDKRRRNTLASARFRIKKKHKTLELERSVVELEGRADDLEREAADLRRENSWLKEMLIMKGRRARGLVEKPEEAEESSEEEEEGDDQTESSSSKQPDKGKGKEREK